ncbi:hypothetical protein [Sphingobium abikonense]|uniref:hypothetical protein n=1 Tax=Sphingobium abikonense TaxID=86193 RepID=UPI003513F09C
MTSLPDLDRRLSRKIETGKAINLTAADLDLLVETGAIDTFRAAVQKYQREQCRVRSARSRSISGGDMPSIAARTGKTSKSSGMTNSESVNEAKARAAQILGKAAQH